MDYQATFNRVYIHLLTQARRSVDRNDTCLYRGPRGLRCAIGCLIPDDKYRPEMEGLAIGQCFYMHVDEAADKRAAAAELIEILGATEEDADFLRALQRAHDGAPVNVHRHELQAHWRRELAQVARAYDLEVPRGY